MQHEQRERQQQRQVNRAAGHHGVVTCVVPVLKSAVGNGGSLFAGLADSMSMACRMRRGVNREHYLIGFSTRGPSRMTDWYLTLK